MLPHFEKDSFQGSLNQASSEEELLVILPSQDPLWSKHLELAKECAIPELTTEKYDLIIHSGFEIQNQKRPFMLVDWKGGDASRLEKRWMANHLAKAIQGRKGRHLVFFLGNEPLMESLLIMEDVVSQFADARFLTQEIKSLRVVGPCSDTMNRLDPEGKIRMEGLHGYRRWVNENPDELTSIEMGVRLQSFAETHGCAFETMTEKELSAEGMNLLLAVGQASSISPPRMHTVSYLPEGKEVPPLMLVGKGITFDTGGINVKPHESHVNCMKNDMGGAALMTHIFMTLVRQKHPKNVVLVIPACENLVAERALKPGAIIRSHSGKEVIVEHTDAEGRLILADALSYSVKKHNPHHVLTAATLTTAALRQFSGFFTPMHFASKEVGKFFLDAATEWGEGLVAQDRFMPFREANLTPAADLTNMGRLPRAATGGAGSNVAAHFLKDFCAAPMIHFDIFASCWNWSGDYPGAHYGATGAPFNTVLAGLRAWAGSS